MNRKSKQGLRLLFYGRVVLVPAHLANLIDNLGYLLITRELFCKKTNTKEHFNRYMFMHYHLTLIKNQFEF